MKRILAVFFVLMVMGMAGGAGAREYTLNLPKTPASGVTVPTAPSGTSIFELVSPVQAGRSGVTLIDKPHTQGTEWTMQVDFSNVSPFSIGMADEGVEPTTPTYTVTLYFSDFYTGGSPYVFPTTQMGGNSPYAIPFTVPTCKYMWGTLTSGVSAFWNFPLKLFSAGN